MTRRVVITGIGAITPLGLNKDEFWEGLIKGKSGVERITSFDVSEFPTQIAAQVKNFEPTDYMEKKEARRMDRFIQFAIAVTQMALDDANLVIDKENGVECGVLMASGIGGIATFEEQHKILEKKGPRRVSPFTIPMMIPNMASGQVAIFFGAKGPCSTVVTACAASNNALGDAYEIIKRGDAQVMIAGGTEAAITPLSVAGFSSMGALSKRNDSPGSASRPFDKERDGFVIGEGAGVMILEKLEYALSRKAHIYAEVIGYGMAGDAYHITAPDPEGDGLVRAMNKAISKAGIRGEDVDYINAHGTSTPLNDKIETKSIKKVFDNHAYNLAISSTKSMTGHCLGAAGVIELVACVLSIKNDLIHPTINYEYPDPDCDLNYVPNKALSAPVNVAMSNSAGFGGHSVSLIVRKV